jgi:Protein of unknown function (DUF1569)
MRLNDLSEALATLRKLDQAPSPSSETSWTLAKVLRHCAQSIDASLVGYPSMKPAVIRKTVGRIVWRRFSAKGQMSHDVEGPIPGAAAIADEPDHRAALAELQRSIEAFRAHDGPLAPHFVFDALSKEDYDRLHAMHLADHLARVTF